jgi:hypothetical protein
LGYKTKSIFQYMDIKRTIKKPSHQNNSLRIVGIDNNKLLLVWSTSATAATTATTAHDVIRTNSQLRLQMVD